MSKKKRFYSFLAGLVLLLLSSRLLLGALSENRPFGSNTERYYAFYRAVSKPNFPYTSQIEKIMHYSHGNFSTGYEKTLYVLGCLDALLYLQNTYSLPGELLTFSSADLILSFLSQGSNWVLRVPDALSPKDVFITPQDKKDMITAWMPADYRPTNSGEFVHLEELSVYETSADVNTSLHIMYWRFGHRVQCNDADSIPVTVAPPIVDYLSSEDDNNSDADSGVSSENPFEAFIETLDFDHPEDSLEGSEEVEVPNGLPAISLTTVLPFIALAFLTFALVHRIRHYNTEAL